MNYNLDIKKETLSNGLQVILVHKPDYQKSLFLLGAKVGGFDIDQSVDGQVIRHKSGIAHYLEHQMFYLDGEDVSDLFANLQCSTNAYTSYTALQMPVEALDSLLSGYLFWQQEADAITEYDATTETDAVKYQILNTLYDTYQLTEDDVRQINALDDYDYTVRLEELTGSLSHKNSNAQQAGSTAVTGDAQATDTTTPAEDSTNDGTQEDRVSDAADMTQMQDILPEEEIE